MRIILLLIFLCVLVQHISATTFSEICGLTNLTSSLDWARCSSNSEGLKTLLLKAGGVVIGALLLVISMIMFLCCPVVYISRYACGCCGSSNQTPGDCCCGGSQWEQASQEEIYDRYSDREVNCNKGCMYALFVIGIGVVILSYFAGSLFSRSADDVTNGIKSGVDFFLNLADSALDDIRLPNGSYPSMIPLNQIETIRTNAQRWKSDFFGGNFDEIKRIVVGSGMFAAFFSAVPVLLLLVGCIAAWRNVRIVLPVLLSVLAFLFQFIYIIIGFVLVIVAFIIHIFCEEVHAQVDRQPGIFQYYVVPMCEDNAPFLTIKAQLTSAEKDYAETACSALLKVCDRTTSYSTSGIVFYCNVSTASSCTTAAQVSNVILGMYVKSGVPTQICNSTTNGNCTMESCSKSCTDPNMAQNAYTAIEASDTASNIIDALNKYIIPWLQCDALIDKVLSLAPLPLCKNLPKALDYMATASLLSGVLLIVAIVVLLMGQKRFINKQEYKLMNSTALTSLIPPQAAAEGQPYYGQQEMQYQPNKF